MTKTNFLVNVEYSNRLTIYGKKSLIKFIKYMIVKSLTNTSIKNVRVTVLNAQANDPVDNISLN